MTMERDLGIFFSLCLMIFCGYKLITEIIKDFSASKLRLESSYPKLIKEIIYYCGPTLKQQKIKYYPNHEISYYESKKKLGCYFSGQKKIVIYVKSHYGSETEKIKDIIHTTLHEVRHYQQHMTNSDFKNYDIYSKKLTYQKNPFEIDSNAWADQEMDNCIKYLKQKGIIS